MNLFKEIIPENFLGKRNGCLATESRESPDEDGLKESTPTYITINWQKLKNRILAKQRKIN